MQRKHSVEHALAAEDHEPIVQRLHVEAIEWERVEPKLAAIAGLPVRVQVQDGAEHARVWPPRGVVMHREGAAAPC
jgi:hypothetical protein